VAAWELLCAWSAEPISGHSGARLKAANPESRSEFRSCVWIPDRRFAASGMTE
jgi:hypothetical protein